MLTFIIDQHMVDGDSIAKTHTDFVSGVGDSITAGEHVRAVDEDGRIFRGVIVGVDGEWIHLRLGDWTRVVGLPESPTSHAMFLALLKAA